jgi:hypothetical protein
MNDVEDRGHPPRSASEQSVSHRAQLCSEAAELRTISQAIMGWAKAACDRSADIAAVSEQLLMQYRSASRDFSPGFGTTGALPTGPHKGVEDIGDTDEKLLIRAGYRG